MKVVLYGRISKDRANETSTETQEREMRDWCEAHHHEPVAVFIDYGKSAFKLDADRAEFERAMAMIENGHAEMLVVWKLDRMMRNTRQWVKENARLEKVGASFASVKEPWFDTSSPIGFALVVLMAALAEMEAEGIQTRALGWHSGRLLRGEVPTGPRPFGYDRPVANKLVINEAEAEVIRWLAESIKEGESLRGLAKELDDKGIAPIRERLDKDGKPCKWSHTTIRSILMNCIIAGKRELKDGTFQNSTKWQPILTDEEWNSVREILTDPTRATVPNSKHSRKLKYLLTSVAKCGKCGGTMGSKSHTTANMRYICRDCGLSIDQREADTFVSEVLLAMIDDAAWDALRAQGKKSDPAAMERLTAKLNHEREKWLDGEISDTEWDATQSQIKARAAKLEQADAVAIPEVGSLRDSWEGLKLKDKRLAILAVTKGITVLPYAKGLKGTKRIVIDMA